MTRLDPHIFVEHDTGRQVEWGGAGLEDDWRWRYIGGDPVPGRWPYIDAVRVEPTDDRQQVRYPWEIEH